MSLSQKHAGLILVPWFNSDEWRFVYELVYSSDTEKQLTALELLKIWKMRTPILSTGVEGTLILLDVLMINTESLSDEHISSLYAVALMRFLNLSAANSEKQGSFTRTSTKNELPKWLTNLRHDIAHGHQIPSKYNLKMGLDFGFKWLKEKYWDPQSKIINDYYIDDEPKLADTLLNSLEVYVDLNINLFEMMDLDSEFYENIRNIIYKKYRRKNLHPYLLLEIFLEMITQSLEKDHDIGNVDPCLDILVSTRALLKPIPDMVSDKEGSVKLNEKLVNIWSKLLNLLHCYGMLFRLVDKLFDEIVNIARSDHCKKMASLWINVIFLSLQKLKGSGVSQEECVLHLEKNKYTYTEESLEFQNKVLYSSSEYSSPYMSEFLDSLLRYNLSNEGFLSDAVTLFKINSAMENLHKAEDKIYSFNDLIAATLEIEDVEFIEPVETDKKVFDSSSDISGPITGGHKWRKIEDTSIFANCPLGVLPHQINMNHPFLILA